MKETVKRILDLLVCVPGLVVLLPAFGAIALVIKFGSKGPVIFRQERAGRSGKPFIFYKFRTMKVGIDPFGPSPKSGGDARLTRVGKLLREWSLDELPQLFNVVKGDMSIVGPRPLYVSQIAEWDEQQRKRLLVKPGLTGLAQVSGRAGLTQEEKLELDVQYVEKASLWFDCRIVAATITMVFGRRGIYEKRYSQGQYTRGEKPRVKNGEPRLKRGERRNKLRG